MNLRFKKYFLLRVKKGNYKVIDKFKRGIIGLKSLGFCYLQQSQIDAAVKVIKVFVKRKEKLLVNVTPCFTLTRKPQDVRMGRGKGNPALKVFPLKAGKLVFELRDVDLVIGFRALLLASKRLSIRSKIVKNDSCTNNIKSS